MVRPFAFEVRYHAKLPIAPRGHADMALLAHPGARAVGADHAGSTDPGAAGQRERRTIGIALEAGGGIVMPLDLVLETERGIQGALHEPGFDDPRQLRHRGRVG